MRSAAVIYEFDAASSDSRLINAAITSLAVSKVIRMTAVSHVNIIASTRIVDGVFHHSVYMYIYVL